MPQLEDGYLKIANELFDALIKFKLPGNELRIALFVIRKTYGYNKKSDWISNSQFVAGTGIHKSTVCRIINTLISKKIVSKDANTKHPKYRFNKNYWQWEQLARTSTSNLLARTSTTVSQDANNQIVDASDNQNGLDNCSSEQKDDQEQLSPVQISESDELSPVRPTKDSNNVTKERPAADGGKKKKQNISKRIRLLTAIASGSTDHSLVSQYAWEGESFEDMKTRASRELDELKRSISK